jgi:hypothetical protein
MDAGGRATQEQLPNPRNNTEKRINIRTINSYVSAIKEKSLLFIFRVFLCSNVKVDFTQIPSGKD